MKSEIFRNFKKFKLLVEKLDGNTIKMLRTNGGGEYTSVGFAQVRKKEKIEHEVISPYTPHHNGIAERKNKSILNTASNMLKAR